MYLPNFEHMEWRKFSNCHVVIMEYMLREGCISPETPGYLDTVRERQTGDCRRCDAVVEPLAENMEVSSTVIFILPLPTLHHFAQHDDRSVISMVA
jgi:hypothetical protein